MAGQRPREEAEIVVVLTRDEGRCLYQVVAPTRETMDQGLERWMGVALDAFWRKASLDSLSRDGVSCVGVTSPIRGEICLFQLSFKQRRQQSAVAFLVEV